MKKILIACIIFIAILVVRDVFAKDEKSSEINNDVISIYPESYKRTKSKVIFTKGIFDGNKIIKNPIYEEKILESNKEKSIKLLKEYKIKRNNNINILNEINR